MNQRIAELQSVLSEDELIILQNGGWGKQRGLGERSALLIIDAQYNYVGENKPILEQIDRWPSGCGEKAWKAIPLIKEMVHTAHEKNVPVIYTRQVQKDRGVRERFDSFGAKIDRPPEEYVDGAKGTQIIQELIPAPGDLVIDKSYASAFFATPLIAWLIKLKIDTLLIMGGSTSGCVRCTAVDASARNYNVGVIMDAVFDRFEYAHRGTLLDLWMKYADLITSEECLEYLTNQQAGD